MPWPARTTARATGLVLTLVLSGMTIACYPGEIDGVGDPDLVFTAFDPAAGFGGFETYAMPDTIIRVDALGTGLPAEPAIDRQILDAVATELAALGYGRLTESSPAAPDVVVVLTVNVEEVPYWENGFWWAYWGWYPGWNAWYPSWEPGWRPQHPWSSRYAGTRPTGTLDITMLEADRPTSGVQAIPVVWAAAIQGLFSEGSGDVTSRFQALIRRAFDQSPYL